MKTKRGYTQSKSKGFAPMILLFLVALIVVGAGAYLYGKGGLKLPTEKQPASSGTRVSVTPTPSNDETTNWKTYTNTQYSYSLKHPVLWEEIIDPKSEGREFTLKLPNGEFVHGTIFSGTRDSSNDNNYRKTFDLAKNKYILITYVECDGPGCGFGKTNLPIFDQILSTFKFTK